MVIARKRSRQQLHHEEDRPVVRLAEVGDVDDVRVIDQARRARLAQEALDRFVTAAVTLVEDLHGNFLTDVDVLAAIDHTHAATTHDLVQLVLPERRSGSGVRRDHLAQCRIAPHKRSRKDSSGKHACAIGRFIEFSGPVPDGGAAADMCASVRGCRRYGRTVRDEAC
jgi:hypothetical protein